ncbi:hypothetical protein [Bacillus infantis]|uniref:GNAT family N-acetyltransferase n=1 Tax=Bacillus infantis TaxID=324767 RepID=A0A5D4RBC3_9BACI|nr:hypothetical protein [Bacillus infantis]TYS47058.1 hypothetical protein FZD51_16520 [Bacillus infantis]
MACHLRGGQAPKTREFNNEQNRVFGLFIEGDNSNIQGLILIQEREPNQLIHISLMEAAPYNQFNNPHQEYASVGKVLLAFAMNYSLNIQRFEGYVGLEAKRNYNEDFYLKLNAQLANLINGKPYYFFSDTDGSINHLKKYLPGGVNICPS